MYTQVQLNAVSFHVSHGLHYCKLTNSFVRMFLNAVLGKKKKTTEEDSIMSNYDEENLTYFSTHFYVPLKKAAIDDIKSS